MFLLPVQNSACVETPKGKEFTQAGLQEVVQPAVGLWALDF